MYLFHGELFGVSVSETTRFALSLPPLRGGPLPFTSPRAAMVSDTDTPKSSVQTEAFTHKESFYFVLFL